MGASFRAQANALIRKNAVYQRRAACFNCVLLSAPIFFCLLLFIMQQLINGLVLNSADMKCGCKCLQCCTASSCRNPGSNETTDCTRPFECGQRSTTECGFQYSTTDQSTYCPIKHPDTYPPLFKLEADFRRAKPWAPNIPAMYTAKQTDVAAQLGPRLFRQPDIVRMAAALSSLLAPTNPDKPFRADALSDMGLVLGTAHDLQQDFYKEKAFFNEEFPLEVLVPAAYCKAANLTSSTSSIGTREQTISVGELLNAVLDERNATLTAAERKQINAVLSQFRSSAGNSSADSAASPSVVDMLELVCTDVTPVAKKNVEEMDDTLYCGWWEARCGGQPQLNAYTPGYDYRDTNKGSKLALDLVFNDTNRLAEPSAGGPGNNQRIASPLNRAVNAWVQWALGDRFSAELTGLMSTPKPKSKLQLDFSSLLGPLFYCWVVQMLLPIFLIQLVYEKEKRLRMMMKMHGLGDAAYWAVTYGWYIALYIAYLLIFLIFGSMVGLKIFTKNSYGIQIIFYFLFANCTIAFAFLLSCFFSSSRTAVVVAFLYVFGTGLIGYLLLAQFMAKNYSWMFVVEWVPAFSLYRGLYELSEYSFLGVYRNSDGMLFENLSDSKNGMSRTWAIFVVEWLLFMLLAWYLEQVYASGTGIRRHPLFFLPSNRKKGEESDTPSHYSPHQQVEVTIDKELVDVVEERGRVASLSSYDSYPIVVKDLRKVYPSLDGAPPKLAVRSLSLAVEKGECFGLLGPNGAGKSTSINMMTGFLEPSSGTAVVGGHNIRSAMAEIYKIMGVCPQHDLLWDTLTGREHLLFYGRLKGLTGSQLLEAVDSGLKSVNLFANKVGDKISKQYSGGMKRRLSVAISFIGDPQVVYLDEPSTGLDPASRRNLWDVVRSSKKGRGIILTTHSMEEAEILCDRLGIFVDGQLVCIGNPKEITARYGDYYVFSLQVPPEQETAAHTLVSRLSANAKLTYTVAGTLKYEVPKQDVNLSTVFNTMSQSQQHGVQVHDWGIANATLEEVFIKFARQIGAKAGE